MPGAGVGGARIGPRRGAARRGGGERLIPERQTTATLALPAAPVLVMLPSRGGRALTRVTIAGLPLDRRIALAAGRAGFGEVLAAGSMSDTAASASCRIVALAGHVVPQTAWLRALLAMPLRPETLYVDPGAVAVIDTQYSDRVLDAAARCGAPENLADALNGTTRVVRGPLEPSGRFVLSGPADVRAAETWLLRSLIKPSEGFMSRHVERRISLAVTRRLARTGITPNTMTLISVGLGLAGAPFFLAAGPLQILGALLFLTHSVLDGCDGEIARLKFQETRGGAVLDFWGDNLVHVAVFAGMTMGWHLATGGAWPLVLGAVTIASALATATIASRRFIGGATVDLASPVARVAEALSHRDFIYLILALALFGKAWWFLAASAVGTPSFLVLLLVLGGRGTARRP